MKRSNGWWFVYAMLVPAMLGGFLAGWQKANAQLPACANCDCKKVIRWWMTGMKSTYANGSRVAGETNEQLTALKLYVGGGCMVGKTPTDDLVLKYDLWRFQNCSITSTVTQVIGIREMTCQDSGSAIGYGIKVRNCE